jgi:hydrogenase maturation protein HypF
MAEVPQALGISNPAMRCHIRVRGQVQGVGFRPFVYRLATELRLSGWVRNDSQGVEIEVQGEPGQVERLMARLQSESPPLARIDGIEHRALPPRPDPEAFLIESSRSGRADTGVTPDAAVCPACLTELFDPADRRYRYAFINCTHCGPRYTLTAALPYDRPQTSMAAFRMCPACQAEYDEPADRRFHAQPNACPLCGPQLSLHDAQGSAVSVPDKVAEALRRLRAGEILALKGLGGFHLVCDATHAAAVARLRERKQREEKPFAVMVANSASIARWAECNPTERRLLESIERPIVLMRKKPGCDELLRGIAPGIAWLGLMLPYTPLHYLLFHEAAGRPEGSAWLARPQDLVLVMTSANPGGEPLVTANDEALQRLNGIADGFVLHDRDIRVRCDDSVVRAHAPALAGIEAVFIRRARGYTPRPIKLRDSGPCVLAVGGGFKNTVCLTRGNEAFVSQHIGDLDNAPTCEALEQTVAHLMRVLEIAPEHVAHDLHPDLFSSRFAAEFAQGRRIPCIGVQHHHAHIAAVMAEHGLKAPVLGLALDGVGLGSDGGIWGGELLRVEGTDFERLGHLKPLALPGGDRATREPWRMAASALYALGRGEDIERRFAHPGAAVIRAMLAKGVHCPPTSSAGRLFDAVAGLLGVQDVMRFEGQAAMLLEGLAERYGPTAALADGYVLEPDGLLSLLPLLGRLVDIQDAGYGAALFHATLAEGLAAWVQHAATAQGLRDIVLGGGCFLNHVLSRTLRAHLQAAGLSVFEASQLPPNDGGLSLGQAWIVLHRIREARR